MATRNKLVERELARLKAAAEGEVRAGHLRDPEVGTAKPLQRAAVPARSRQAEKAAARERMADEPVAEEELMSPFETQDEAAARQQMEAAMRRRAILGATVATRIRDAKTARANSGIEDIWDADDDQYNGTDRLGSDDRQTSRSTGRNRPAALTGRSRLFVNITQPKTKAGVARVKEMLLPTDDKPWSIGPSPIPELSDEIAKNPDRPVQLGDGSMAPAKDVVAVTLERARQAADKMGTWIEDRFVEGDVYAQMRLVIEDAGRIGTGVLKGPFAVARKDRKWIAGDNGMTVLVEQTRNEPTSKRVDPRDVFPDPSCGDNIHDGAYFLERAYLTGRQLRDLAEIDGYDQAAILESLMEGPRAYAKVDNNRRGDRIGESSADALTYEVWYYYGDCSPDDLLAMEIELSPAEMLLLAIPAIVTVVNERPIRAIVNPQETGEFPYDFFPWDPVAGQPWGRGLPFKMATAQVMLNSSVRRMFENAGLSAGAQIAITEGVLIPADGKYEITGRKLWKFRPNEAVNDINKAMAVFTIPSMQQELSAIIQFALQMSDELTNLPQLMQGQNNREGEQAAPQTFGGMTMLMNSANAPLRVIAKQFDDYVVTRHLRRYYDWGMQSPDVPQEAKGDHQIKALGASVLVQREAGRELLSQLGAMVDDPSLHIDKSKWLAEFAKGYGYTLSQIQYSEDEQKQREEQAKGATPPTDPRIEAAHIAAETAKARIEAETRKAELDRAQENAIEQIKFQIQALQFAGQKEITFEQLRTMLATKAMDGRLKSDEMRLKLSPQNRSGMGI